MMKFLKRLFGRSSKSGKPRKCRHCHALVTTNHECTTAQREVQYSDDSDFLASMAVGYATDSALIGHAVGGDFAGAMIGEMLRTRPDDAPSPYSNDSPEPDNSSAYVPDPTPMILESPDPTPSFDSSPSYDSSPSVDSSPSIDSGSFDSSGGSTSCDSTV